MNILELLFDRCPKDLYKGHFVAKGVSKSGETIIS